MPESPPPTQSLARAREQKINELSTHFANDDLSLDDLERRIERVYKAASVVELEEITADLRKAVAPPEHLPLAGPSSRSSAIASSYHVEEGRVMALMSSTRRVGRWAVPHRLKVVAIMSDTKIDFTHAAMPNGIVDLDLRAVMASCRLVVSPNIRVINETHSVMSTVRSRADEMMPDDAPASAESPVIRLRGYAIMSDIKVVVRRVEDPVYDDDDDD